jgi:hypothetical protein
MLTERSLESLYAGCKAFHIQIDVSECNRIFVEFRRDLHVEGADLSINVTVFGIHDASISHVSPHHGNVIRNGLLVLGTARVDLTIFLTKDFGKTLFVELTVTAISATIAIIVADLSHLFFAGVTKVFLHKISI